jgi:putative hemolysin
VRTLTPDPLLAETSLFRVSLAQSPEELVKCQRLRYEVFNLELGEGLSTSDRSGLDIDPFDAFCDHLMVSDLESGKLVGTYRLQTGEVARRNLGYYGNQIFDFSVYEPVRKEFLELGRACVHVDYRNIMVLHALWKGIAVYATRNDMRYLVGCSSISSQDENYGVAMYESLKNKYLVAPHLRTEPQPGHACVANGTPVEAGRPPRLFRAYLEISGRICGPPAIDREFKTIDFLTLVDLANLPDRVLTRFFNP